MFFCFVFLNHAIKEQAAFLETHFNEMGNYTVWEVKKLNLYFLNPNGQENQEEDLGRKDTSLQTRLLK